MRKRGREDTGKENRREESQSEGGRTEKNGQQYSIKLGWVMEQLSMVLRNHCSRNFANLTHD